MRLTLPLLIDGHNLIGSGVLEDISLQDEDDEERLVRRLRVWRSDYRGEMTVVFDRGIVGGTSRELSGAGVEVIFARNPQEADDWIMGRIHNRPEGLIVVTNDWALREEAKLHAVETWQADEFVSRMVSGRGRPASGGEEPVEQGAETEVNLSDREVSDWIATFGPSLPAQKRVRAPVSRHQEPGGSAFARDRKALQTRLQKKRRKR